SRRADVVLDAEAEDRPEALQVPEADAHGEQGARGRRGGEDPGQLDPPRHDDGEDPGDDELGDQDAEDGEEEVVSLERGGERHGRREGEEDPSSAVDAEGPALRPGVHRPSGATGGPGFPGGSCAGSGPRRRGRPATRATASRPPAGGGRSPPPPWCRRGGG